MEINKKLSSHIVDNSHYSAWIIDVREFLPYINHLKQCLSKQERKKYEEIKKVPQKELFCLRKGILRILLSELCDLDPSSLHYVYGLNGKPYIPENVKGIEFNISHSKEYLLVGAAEQIDIGVDIEKINDKLDCIPIAKGIFSPEEFSLFTTYRKPKQLRSFYKAWVQKEAISKALGLGLAVGFNGFTVRIDPEICQEEYEVKLHKMKACIRLSVHLETDYALAIALIEKGVD